MDDQTSQVEEEFELRKTTVASKLDSNESSRSPDSGKLQMPVPRALILSQQQQLQQQQQVQKPQLYDDDDDTDLTNKMDSSEAANANLEQNDENSISNQATSKEESNQAIEESNELIQQEE